MLWWSLPERHPCVSNEGLSFLAPQALATSGLGGRRAGAAAESLALCLLWEAMLGRQTTAPLEATCAPMSRLFCFVSQ